MSESLTEKRLKEIFNVEDKPFGFIPEMYSDFRKMEVRYLCTAGERESICVRFKVGSIGICTFKATGGVCNWMGKM